MPDAKYPIEVTTISLGITSIDPEIAGMTDASMATMLRRIADKIERGGDGSDRSRDRGWTDDESYPRISFAWRWQNASFTEPA